jgi:hypothetical protein
MAGEALIRGLSGRNVAAATLRSVKARLARKKGPARRASAKP